MFFHVKQMTKNLAVDPKDYGPGLVDTIKRKLVTEVIPRPSLAAPVPQNLAPRRHPPTRWHRRRHVFSSWTVSRTRGTQSPRTSRNCSPRAPLDTLLALAGLTAGTVWSGETTGQMAPTSIACRQPTQPREPRAAMVHRWRTRAASGSGSLSRSSRSTWTAWRARSTPRVRRHSHAADFKGILNTPWAIRPGTLR